MTPDTLGRTKGLPILYRKHGEDKSGAQQSPTHSLRDEKVRAFPFAKIHQAPSVTEAAHPHHPFLRHRHWDRPCERTANDQSERHERKAGISQGSSTCLEVKEAQPGVAFHPRGPPYWARNRKRHWKIWSGGGSMNSLRLSVPLDLPRF